MRMMICKKCNNQVPEDSQFCPFCGNQFVRLERPEPPVTHASEAVAVPAAVTPEAALKRAFIFIEDGLFDRADQYLEFILDQDPENAQAYLGKLMIDLRLNTPKQLAEQAEPFDRNGNYIKAVRYGDDELICLLKGYIFQVNEKRIERQNEEKYTKATRHLEQATTFSDLAEARALLEELKEYKDSKNLLLKIPEAEKELKERKEKEKKERIYQEASLNAQTNDIYCLKKAIDLFKEIPNWYDSNERIKNVERKIDTIRAEKERERVRLEEQRRKEEKKENLTLWVYGILAVAIIVFAIVWGVRMG